MNNNINKGKNLTLDDVAVMLQNGFDDMLRNFDKLLKRMDKIASKSNSSEKNAN